MSPALKPGLRTVQLVKPTVLLETRVPRNTQTSGAPSHLSGLWPTISHGCVCSEPLLSLSSSCSPPSAQYLPQPWSRAIIFQRGQPEPTEAEN